MKKIISIIFLISITLGVVGLVIYILYIKPLTDIKGLNHWYDYLLAIFMLSVIYVILYFAVKGVLKLIDWAASNVD